MILKYIFDQDFETQIWSRFGAEVQSRFWSWILTGLRYYLKAVLLVKAGNPWVRCSFGNVCHIIQIAWLEKQISSSLQLQVKTHEMPDWGLASCIDSLNLASPSADRILGCANGGEVWSLTLFLENNKIMFYVKTQNLRELTCCSNWGWRPKALTLPFSGFLGLPSMG